MCSRSCRGPRSHTKPSKHALKCDYDGSGEVRNFEEKFFSSQKIILYFFIENLFRNILGVFGSLESVSWGLEVLVKPYLSHITFQKTYKINRNFDRENHFSSQKVIFYFSIESRSGSMLGVFGSYESV